MTYWYQTTRLTIVTLRQRRRSMVAYPDQAEVICALHAPDMQSGTPNASARFFALQSFSQQRLDATEWTTRLPRRLLNRSRSSGRCLQPADRRSRSCMFCFWTGFGSRCDEIREIQASTRLRRSWQIDYMENAMSKFGERRNLVIGAVIGLVAGPIITSLIGWQVGFSTMEEQVSAAVVEQQALFCEQRTLADPAYVDSATFKALEVNAKRDFVIPHAQMPGQDAAGRAVVNACLGKLREG